jgi:twitching motility protein PilJ
MFASLRIWQKLGLLIVLMSLPLVVLINAYLKSRNELIVFTEAELVGTEYLRRLSSLLEQVQLHRAASNAYLSGDASYSGHMKGAASRVESEIKHLDQVDLRTGTKLGTRELWEQWKQKWQQLQSRSGQLSPATSFEQHTALTAMLIEIYTQVGDLSNLILDPETDSYYLASGLIDRFTRAAEARSLTAGYGLGLAAKKNTSPEERGQAQALTRQLQSSLVDLSRHLALASKYNAQTGEVVRPLYDRLKQATDTELQWSAAPPRSASVLSDQWEAHQRLSVFYSELAEGMRRRLNTQLTDRISRLRSEKYGQLGLAGLALVLAALGAFKISSGITRQTSDITGVFSRIDEGDYTARCKPLTKDELGAMAVSLNAAMDNTLTLIQSRHERDQIQHSIKRLLEEVSGVADGDLTKEAEVTADMTGAIADSFNFMIAELRQIISQVQQTTITVSRAAGDVQGRAESLAQGSELQSTEILNSSRAIEGMATSIQAVSAIAGEAAQVAQQALTNAEQGTEAVDKTIGGMNSIRLQVQETAKRIKRLGESSQEIGEIVQLIRDVAERTSILALNASIQAAMAGDAGRGFAMVAEEVERLAQRAGESTKRIAALIESVQSDTGEAVAAMEATTHEVVQGSRLANEAGQRLAEIQKVSREISQLVRSIASDANRQARESVDVSQQVVSISRVSQQTAEGTRDAAAAVRRLAELAEDLNTSVSRFRLPEGQGATTAVA